jgi:hypothetical protein
MTIYYRLMLSRYTKEDVQNFIDHMYVANSKKRKAIPIEKSTSMTFLFFNLFQQLL